MTDIGLSIPWIIGFWISGSILGVALLALLIWGVIATTQGVVNKKIRHLQGVEMMDWMRENRGKPEYYFRSQYREKEWMDGSFWLVVTSIISGGLAVFIIVVQLLCCIPFQVKYLDWFHYSGTVTDVQTVIQTDGDHGVTNMFTVTLSGFDRPVTMTDTRVLTITEEQPVKLLCGVSWEDFGHAADKWSCDLVDY